MSEFKTKRELDQLVAEKVMGHTCNCDGNTRQNPHKMPDFCPIHGATYYSTVIADAMDVENRIAELRFEEVYAIILWNSVEANASGELTLWRCIHASPEQRCLAALKAVEENQ